MENNISKAQVNSKQKFLDKYGIWLLVIGLIAIIFILKFILDFFK